MLIGFFSISFFFNVINLHSRTRALVRIIRDMRRRFQGLVSLNSWMALLLVHHAINSHKPGEPPLGVAAAFRRCLQLLAGGIFLPGAAGIVDPCRTDGSFSVHESLSLEDMDKLCFTAQTLLRVNSHGGARQILGLEDTGDFDISTDTTCFGQIVVTASERAYDPEEHERWRVQDEAANAVDAAIQQSQNNEEKNKEQSSNDVDMDKEMNQFMAEVGDTNDKLP